VRNIFTRNGGNLATSGALEYVFDRKGIFKISPPAGDFDELELELIDHGLEEIFEADDGILLYCGFKQYADLQRVLEARSVEVKSAAIQRIPTNYVKVTSEQEEEIQKLIERLEEDDDVQVVFHNMQSNEE
jgi:transcriptional/translational regulatory protein YebC/TACO1